MGCQETKATREDKERGALMEDLVLWVQAVHWELEDLLETGDLMESMAHRVSEEWMVTRVSPVHQVSWDRQVLQAFQECLE